MLEKRMVMSRRGRFSSKLVGATVVGLVGCGVLSPAALANGVTPQVNQSLTSQSSASVSLPAMSNTTSQQFVQLRGVDISSQTGKDTKGKPFHMGGKYLYNADFEMDNGAYDELLTETSDDAFGKHTSKLFITNLKLYYQQGKKWVASGSVPSTTIDEETQLVDNMQNVTSKKAGSRTEYTGSLDGKYLATLFDNEFLQAQQNTAFDKMASDLPNRGTVVVTVTTTKLHGTEVVQKVTLNVDVTLTKAESVQVWGATGNTSKLTPFHFTIRSRYSNTFRSLSFPSPIDGKVPTA